MMFVIAIVIGCYRARADVRTRAHPRVTDIGQMVGFGAGLDNRLLHLDEIADMRVLADRGAGSQTRKRPDPCPRCDCRSFQMREAENVNAVGDTYAGAEDHMRLDNDVLADSRVSTEKDRLWSC